MHAFIDLFSTLCTVTADTSAVTRVKQLGTNGVYYTQDFKVVLMCGLTEMKAHISWIQDVSIFLWSTGHIHLQRSHTYLISTGHRETVSYFYVE